ncbi:MAG TPA: phage tail tube protein [Candidatus Enterenecus stercoripullorum]|nr:phage tail tube protein [Candidatus Enterenecus stercoripullorum]
MLDQRVMSGTWGQVWVDGELWAELSAFQAKYTYNKTDINMCGEMTVGSKVTNVKGTGSITVHKVYTRNHSRSDQILAGRDVRATIVGKLDDPDAYGAERVALYNVSFDDETIMDFTAGSPGSTTHPFTFSRREWLDTVSA